MRLSQLVEAASERRRNGEIPSLIAVGHVERHIETDGTVASLLGFSDLTPVFRLEPRIYRITDGGGVEITDDHPDWLARNDEVETIPGDDLDLVLIAEPMNDGLKTPPDADNVFVYPEVSD